VNLALGTVQFGLDYGISNSTGRTPLEEVERILISAREQGINTLDTAVAYGDSETVLGHIGVSDWRVVSKVPVFQKSGMSGKEWVLHHLRESLERLRIRQLDSLLLHSAADLLGEEGHQIAAGLYAAKAEGLVGKVGYSIYSSQPLRELVQIMLPDLIQAPLNVFDQRLVRSGWLNRLLEMGVEVHTRSVFMQGLLLMTPETRPQAFVNNWNDLLGRWDTTVGEQSERALALCLGFVKGHSGISRVVLGVESLKQLDELMKMWDTAVLFEANEFACDDPQLIEPSNWKLK
jgi:aryl-alcohol dehydrogenase-like predicted oxidoreductase